MACGVSWIDMIWHDIKFDMWYNMSFDIWHMTWYTTCEMTWHVTWHLTWHVTFDMTWHDITWYNMTCEMTWHYKWHDMTQHVTWHDMWHDRPCHFICYMTVTSHGMNCHDMMWHGTKWHDMWYDMWHDVTWHDMKWNDMTWTDMTWNHMIWHDMMWYDMSWHKTACPGIWYLILAQPLLNPSHVISQPQTCTTFRACFLNKEWHGITFGIWHWAWNGMVSSHPKGCAVRTVLCIQGN